ncbi:MAG: hypothetical protein AB7F89_23420 [Pirellulaceae bacterium]
MDTSSTLFFGPGQRAALTSWSGRCLFEFLIERPLTVQNGDHKAPSKEGSDAGSETSSSLRARVEIFLVPTGPSGLAAGDPVALVDEEVTTRKSSDGRWQGYLLLPPSVDVALARRCHFRLTAVP